MTTRRKMTPASLRRAAEARLRARPAPRPQSPVDTRRLQHELEVHQIELEMQLEELNAGHARTVAALARNTELYDFAPVGFFTLTREGRIARANLAGARLVGRDRTYLVRRRFSLLVAETDRPVFRALLARVFASAERQVCELAMVSETGRPLIGRIKATRSPDGQECLAALIDVTDRRKAETQLRLFVENCPAAVAMFDRDMRYLIVSRRFLADYQLGEQTVIGRSHYEVFPDLPERWKAANRRCLGGAVEKSDDDSFLRADGTTTWVRWEIHPWRDVTGRVGGIILFSEVITVQKHAEAALRALTARLQTVREEERTGIARELHDVLGQGLTALQMDLRWLARGLASAAPELKGLQARVGEMIPLLADLTRATQRISAELRPSVLDRIGLAEAMEWQLDEFAKRTGLRTQADLPASGWEHLLDPGSETALFRIFQEALTNVARHAQARGVRVRLRRERDAVRLEIEDDGCGITPAQRDDPKALGLLGMKERLSACGGVLAVTGAPGRGTRVSAMVPRRSSA